MTMIDERILYILIELIGAIGTVVAVAALAYQRHKDRVYEERKQAQSVSCWIFHENEEYTDESIEGNELREDICISNLSGLPVYDVIVSRDICGDYTDMQTGVENCRYTHCVPIGNYTMRVPSTGSGMSKKYNASITFRDANNVSWHRDANGYLQKISQNSIDFRKMERPILSTDIILMDNK